MAGAEVLESLRAQGMEPLGGSPERLGAMTRGEVSNWRSVAQAARIQAG